MNEPNIINLRPIFMFRFIERSRSRQKVEHTKCKSLHSQQNPLDRLHHAEQLIEEMDSVFQ